MSSNDSGNAIGLAELVEQVKQELLSAAPSKDNVPILFVDSVELQLQVTVKRERQSKVKVEVVAIGGVEVGGGGSRDDVHQIKVTMSPIFDKTQLLQWYKELYPNEVIPAIKNSLDGLMKGGEGNLADRY